MIRVAQFHGIPYGPPRPDPVVQDFATRAIAAEQPYIYRLTRLGQAAARRGKGLGFAHEAGQLIWGGAQDWHLGDHLADAARRAGLDLAELDARSEEHTSELQSLMRISYAVFCLKKKKRNTHQYIQTNNMVTKYK